LHWVTRYRLGKPTEPLGTSDLDVPATPLELTGGDAP
jgi:exodeoxyribonuclease-5